MIPQINAPPDFNTDEIKVSLRDELVIAAMAIVGRDGSNFRYWAFRHDLDPGRWVET